MSGCHAGTVPDESAVLVAIGFSEAFSMIKFSVITNSVLPCPPGRATQPLPFWPGPKCVWVLQLHGALGKT